MFGTTESRHPLGIEKYDYIITGAGCAGLSLIIHLIHSEKFRNKKILIIDKDAKTRNDRTWCFWEKDATLFQSIVYKEWEHLYFYSNVVSKELHINPYRYKLIRGIDFYKYCLEQIQQQPNVTFLRATVDEICSDDTGTAVVADGKKFIGTYIFNSILFSKPFLKKGHHWLLQHFKGWFITANSPVFNSSAATLMDFRTDQSGGTTFFYTLPFSPTEALVEYTLFSDKLLDDATYEEALQNYIKTVLCIPSYTIIEKEFGVIPMTNFSFPASKNNIINLGTAGGQTKSSSGYTFKFIQKHAAAIVHSLEKEEHPFAVAAPNKRFHFYDSVLLNILHNKTLGGAQIFSDLFKKNKPQQVLKFLDNETNLKEELSIISSLPTAPFFKAAVKQTID